MGDSGLEPATEEWEKSMGGGITEGTEAVFPSRNRKFFFIILKHFAIEKNTDAETTMEGGGVKGTGSGTPY